MVDPHVLRVILLVVFVPVLLLALWRLSTGASDDPRSSSLFGQDKRRARRVQSDTLFDLDDLYGNFRPGNARLVDVSIWGACVVTDMRLEEGQSVRGRLRNSTDGYLKISGHVVWRKHRNGQTLYGIEFDEVTRLPVPT